MAAISYKYRAFLSYSHRDAAWARWLHKALEGQRIDREMVGRTTLVGPVPKTLRPIFRDREDFAAGHSLTEQTTAALEASQFLVVLCSPNAAKSPYVNEEIRFFKALGRAERVIPIIIEGEPAEGEQDCFPPALRFRVGADGQLTNEREEPIAADARPQGDGREIAKRKLVAGLLGVGLDEIERREERARRRRNRILGGVAATFMLLALLASASAAYAWQQLKTNEAFLNATLKTATEIVNTAVEQAERYNMPRKATLALLRKAEGLFDEMSRLSRPTPELRYRKAWMLIEFARNYRKLGQSDQQLAHATEAQRLMAGLAAERPDDQNYQRDLSIALEEVGKVLVDRGRLAEALQAFRESLAIRSRVTASGAAPARAWHDEMLVSIRIGEILVLQGDLERALASFTWARQIGQNLVALNDREATWSRALADVNERIGDVLTVQGDFAGALEAHRTSLALREKLAAEDPTNRERKQGLMGARSKLGATLFMQQDFAGALPEFQAALRLAEQLALADPDEGAAQSDLAASYERTGACLEALQRFDEALTFVRAALAGFEKLLQKDPANTDSRRGLMVSHNRIGGILRKQKNHTAALAHYEIAMAQAHILVQTDPTHTGWRRDLAVVHAQLADVYLTEKKFESALAAALESLALFETLASSDPSNAVWRNDLRVTLETISSIGYYALVAREFGLALKATGVAAARATQPIWLQLNHAHALMFAGRVEEARALYLKHRGVPDAQDGKSWDAVVLGDFTELRQAGLTHPLMEEIERAFATAG